MKFLIYEHTLAETASKDFSQILCEGYSMLKTITDDFRALGYLTTVILNKKYSGLSKNLNVDKIVYISSSYEREKSINTILSGVDAAIAIAPETDGILYDIVKKIEENDCISLNCPSHVLYKYLRKSAVYADLKRNNVSIPKTANASLNEKLSIISQKILSVGYPAIIKPEDSVGCSGISLIENKSQITSALKKVKKYSNLQEFLIQEYIQGNAASVSLLCDLSNTIFLTLNGQWITLQNPFSDSQYLGGFVPFESEMKDLAFKEAEKAVKALNPIRGYVGIDVILTERKIYVVDVNPRFTTSYIGLRKILKRNPIELLLTILEKGKIPKKLEKVGYSFFVKTENSKIIDVEYTSPKFGLYSIAVALEPSLKKLRKRFLLLSKELFTKPGNYYI